MAKQTFLFVNWRVGIDGQPPVAGGFLRCDTQEQVNDFIEQLAKSEIKCFVSTEEIEVQ